MAALQAAEQQLVTLHHEDFPQARPPEVPAPAAVNESAILRSHIKSALRGVGLFNRTGRQQAKHHGREQAVLEIGPARLRRLSGLAQQQTAAIAAWDALVAHEPEAVMTELEEAFEDNQYPAACLSATRDNGVNRVSLLVLFESLEMIPDKAAGRTPTGKPTVKKRSKTDRNELYLAALGSMVLATVKETFAVSPKTDVANVLVLRQDRGASTAQDYLTAIYAANFEQAVTLRLPWRTLDPAETLMRVPDALLRRKGVAREVSALDLRGEPELVSILDMARADLWRAA